jgi:ATP:ADP antiporter, AAA family
MSSAPERDLAERDSAAREPLWLSRALRPITEVRPGEATTALLLTLNVFLLLSAYYIIKPVREALILALESGAEYKSYMSGAIAILLLFAVPAYAKFVDRLPRIKLVISVTLFFAANLLVFLLLMQVPSLKGRLGLVFYAWVGVFNMMVVAQFWSFANDLYDEEKGTRLFPMVALGASLGAAVGSQVAALLIPLLGVPAMLVVAMLVLMACALLFWLVERREATLLKERPAAAEKAPSLPSKSGAFALVLSNRYLSLVALFSVVFSWVNTNGEYMLGKVIQKSARAAVHAGTATDLGAQIGATYAEFFFYVNVLGVLLQSFVVARLVRWLGFRLCFLVFPLIALGDASAIVIAPVLLTITLGKTAENATDYSLNNTLRQTLWLVTSHDMKYKAKQAIDTFFVRMGDVSSALSVWIGASLLALDVRHFAALNVVLVAVWLCVAMVIGREHEKLSAARPEGIPATDTGGVA